MRYEARNVEASLWYPDRPHPEVVTGVLEKSCDQCKAPPHEHGMINGQVLCPGDYIITGSGGRQHACKQALFREVFM